MEDAKQKWGLSLRGLALVAFQKWQDSQPIPTPTQSEAPMRASSNPMHLYGVNHVDELRTDRPLEHQYERQITNEYVPHQDECTGGLRD